MSIGTDDVIDKFGTLTEVTTSPATVADGALSIASDTGTYTHSDDSASIMAVLSLTATGLAGAPDVGSVINLLVQPLNVDGSTGDQAEPTTTYLETTIGSFAMKDADADNNIMIGPLRLPNGKTSAEYVPFIDNESGVALGTTWQLYFIPIADGPHP